tara:strand:+ start:93 stop:311 length:219 start_codon:yes stop_codon:yes gene_type:complete
MDKISFEEIVSILAMHGRPDLIAEVKEHVKIDEEYKPPLRTRKDSLSDSEGSAISEEEYEVKVDENGFVSLK